MLDLLNQIVSRALGGDPFAVCTLVRTRGSTPQKSGAMMLVLPDGKTLGTIGGGCVEAEVRSRALRMMFSPANRLLTFKLDHDHGWDDGLVCGGTMDVAVQVITQADHAQEFQKARDGVAAGDTALLHIAVPDEQDQIHHFDSPILPSPALVIAGAGHVGAALASVAAQMDFRITVIDDRADFAASARFPNATVRLGTIDTELRQCNLNEHTYVVIVTRGHQRDALALAAVVQSKAKYIGLIGSRRKVIKIFSDLREQGVSPEHLDRVHAPIGLDIGAVTPAEIALSIAAELIAVRRDAINQPILPMRLSKSQIDAASA